MTHHVHVYLPAPAGSQQRHSRRCHDQLPPDSSGAGLRVRRSLLALAALDAVGRPLVAVGGCGVIRARAHGVFQRHFVVEAKRAGNVDARRAGHAIAAGGAADLRALAQVVADAPDKSHLVGAHAAGLGDARDGQVLIEVVHAVHPTEGDRRLRVIQYPAQRKLPRRPLGRHLLALGFEFLRQRLAQRPAPQRFHDDDIDAFACRVHQTLGPGLIVLVQVVVLYLAKAPVPRVDDALEDADVIVERKTRVTDAPGIQQPLQPVEHTQPVDFIP